MKKLLIPELELVDIKTHEEFKKLVIKRLRKLGAKQPDKFRLSMGDTTYGITIEYYG